MITSDIKGLDKVLSSLKILPENIQKNVMSGAIRAGCKPLVKEAKLNAPEDKGTLKKSIGITKRKTKNKHFNWYSVSPRRGGKYDAFYAHMVENGTSKMPAQPFLRPAFENQDKESIEAAKEYMRKRIPKEIEKARK